MSHLRNPARPPRLMSPARLIAAALAAVLLFGAPGAASATPEECTACTKGRRQECGVSCQNQLSREAFDRCSDDCVLHSCEKQCELSGLPKEIMLNNPHARCLQCIQDHETGDCLQECTRNTINVQPCVKKCSRRRCGDICDVTDLPVIEEQPSTKLDCEMCRANVKVQCSQAPECHPGEPGFVACQTLCLNAHCRHRCTPDEED